MYFELNNKMKMPKVGLGTWQLDDKEKLYAALDCAIDCGYKLIDTAAIYKNEDVIGQFLKNRFMLGNDDPKKLDREDIFITSKLWNDSHDKVREACYDSCKRLNVDYLDLYLIHWPVNFNGEFNLEKVWKEMEKLVTDGMVKAIGVSNFGIKNLTHLMQFCKIPPVVNEIEMHPYLPQKEIRDFCKKNNIVVISYSTLGSTALTPDSKVNHTQLKNDPVILDLVKKYQKRSENCSSVQILLSYAVQEGCAIIPRSSSPDHIQSNLNLIKLDEEDMERIRGIKYRMRFVDPDFGPARFD